MKLTQEQKAFVEDLLSRMTLDEKIGQMNQESPSIVGGFDVPFTELIEMMTDGRISQEEFGRIMSTAKQDFHEDDIRASLVGSQMVNDPRQNNALQKIAVEESRLGIPLIIGFDVIHGFRSVFPIAIGEACSFDDALFEETAHMAAAESRAHGINWNFAPMIDAARDSRWGRVSEGPGEDPLLGSRFARAKIRGLQNDRSSALNYVAACTKHYVAYGACESGRDYNTTSMSVSNLYNVYLPAFRAAMEEGAATVMAAFNDLNGVPCTVNRWLLRDILKKEFGLDGFVVSDANAIRKHLNGRLPFAAHDLCSANDFVFYSRDCRRKLIFDDRTNRQETLFKTDNTFLFCKRILQLYKLARNVLDHIEETAKFGLEAAEFAFRVVRNLKRTLSRFCNVLDGSVGFLGSFYKACEPANCVGYFLDRVSDDGEQDS